MGIYRDDINILFREAIYTMTLNQPTRGIYFDGSHGLDAGGCSLHPDDIEPCLEKLDSNNS